MMAALKSTTPIGESAARSAAGWSSSYEPTR